MGFSFNGTTSRSMGIATRITTENRMPYLRNNTITMPGHEGVFDFGGDHRREEDTDFLLYPSGEKRRGLPLSEGRYHSLAEPGQRAMPAHPRQGAGAGVFGKA